MAKKFKQHYFPHDAFAREDPKIVRLRIAHGSAGYGVYFMLLELLCSQPDFVSETTYNEIGYNLHESASLVKSVVEDFGLFTLSEDGKWFHSDSFSSRMTSIDSAAKSRSQAASKAAKARWATAPTSSEPKKDARRMRDASKKDADAMRDASVSDANNKIKENIHTNIARTHTCACEDDFPGELLADNEFWEACAMRFGTDRESPKKMLVTFVQECKCKDKKHESFTDFRRHFFDWLRIQTENKKRNGNNTTAGRRGRAESTATCPDDFEGGF